MSNKYVIIGKAVGDELLVSYEESEWEVVSRPMIDDIYARNGKVYQTGPNVDEDITEMFCEIFKIDLNRAIQYEDLL